MKKLLYLLLITSSAALAQLPCLVPPASGIADADKFMFCNGSNSRSSTFSLFKAELKADLDQILDTAKVPYIYAGRSTGYVYFDGTRWISQTPAGSGTVNSGTQYRLGYYATTGTAISEAPAITGSRALVSDANGVPTHSATTATELGYISGVTSSIQTQINTKATNPMTTIGDAIIAGASGTPTRLGGNQLINRKVLAQVGDSSAVTSTLWTTLQNTDMVQSEQVSLGWGSGALFFNFGDSFTNGDGPFLSSATYRYTNTIAEKLGTTLSNLGVNSEGVFNCFKRVANAETTLPNQFSATMMIGFNDIRSNYSRAGVNKIANGHRAIIAQHFLSSGVAANNVLVTTSGTWTTVAAGTYNDKASLSFSGLARQSSVAGSTLTYTSTGSNLVIGCWGSNTTTFDDGRFTVTIDGNLVTTWDPANNAVLNSQDPGRNHNALCYFNLGGGTHTVVITTLDNKPTLIDYFGVLQDASRAPTFLVMGLLKQTTAGYSLIAGLNDAIFENCNQRIISVINEFRAQGYGVRYVEGNDNGWNPTTMISTIDNIHPNRLGHAKIAENFLRAVNRTFVPSQHSSLNLKAKHSTAQAGLFASNDNTSSQAIGVVVYPTGQSVSGWTGPNIAAVQSSCASVNFGSYTSASTVGLVAGGFTANDRKVTLTSAGVFKLQYGTANTQMIVKDSIAANEASLSLLNNTNVELKARVTGSFKSSFSANSSAELVTGATQLMLVNSNASPSIGFSMGILDANIKMRLSGTNGLLAVGHGSPTAAFHLIGLASQSLGNVPVMNVVAGPYLGLATGTERPEIIFDISKTNNWDAGTVALQRSIVVRAGTFTFNSPSTMTEADAWNFNGANVAGSNATITNNNAVTISARAVGSGTVNSYGLTVNAQTGGTNNYAARFLGGRVGIGTSSPQSRLHVAGGVRVDSLAGSGTRMVVAGSNGYLSTQAIPSGMTNPMTNTGDIIVGGASGTPTRVGIGANGTYPRSNGSTLAYSNFTTDVQAVGDARYQIKAFGTVGSNYTLTAADHTIFNAGSSTYTLTLPDATTMPGQQFELKLTRNATGSFILNTTGGQTVDGLASGAVTVTDYTKVESSGSNWFIVAPVRKDGSTTLTYDGVTTVFNIPHGLGFTPNSVPISARNYATHGGGAPTITVDATNITITYAVAPSAGSNIIDWSASK